MSYGGMGCEIISCMCSAYCIMIMIIVCDQLMREEWSYDAKIIRWRHTAQCQLHTTLWQLIPTTKSQHEWLRKSLCLY